MSVLVLGENGQVAKELARLGAATAGRTKADFATPDAVINLLEAARPSAVINAAAYTAVDRAESEPDLAHQINAVTPGAIANWAATNDVPLVHLSTDYVFDGSGDQPRNPDATTGPLNVYGKTKLAGEVAIQNAGCRHVILRTSWVFSAHGNNFVKTMLRLSETRDRLTVVADQIGGPTAAADIAAATLALTDPSNSGVYHFAGQPSVSWAEFAREIFAMSGRQVDVADIATADYPTDAARPLNSRLSGESLQSDFGISQPDWRDSLRKVLIELGAVT